MLALSQLLIVLGVSLELCVAQAVKRVVVFVFNDVEFRDFSLARSAGAAGSLNIGRLGGLAGGVNDVVDLVGVDSGS